MAKWDSGNHGGLKLPDICLTGEEKPRKNLTQETCPDRGSNRGPLPDRRACYCLLHSGERIVQNKLLRSIHNNGEFRKNYQIHNSLEVEAIPTVIIRLAKTFYENRTVTQMDII